MIFFVLSHAEWEIPADVAIITTHPRLNNRTNDNQQFE